MPRPITALQVFNYYACIASIALMDLRGPRGQAIVRADAGSADASETNVADSISLTNVGVLICDLKRRLDCASQSLRRREIEITDASAGRLEKNARCT
jgi:hypothetical protein